MTIFEELSYQIINVEDTFTICSSASDCEDYNGCTADTCDLSLCNNTKLEEELCNECAQVTILINPDNYPDETKWYLKEIAKKK